MFSGLLLCCYLASFGLCQLNRALRVFCNCGIGCYGDESCSPLEAEQHMHWYHAVSVSSISSALDFPPPPNHNYIGTERKYSRLLHNSYFYCTWTAGLLKLLCCYRALLLLWSTEWCDTASVNAVKCKLIRGWNCWDFTHRCWQFQSPPEGLGLWPPPPPPVAGSASRRSECFWTCCTGRVRVGISPAKRGQFWSVFTDRSSNNALCFHVFLLLVCSMNVSSPLASVITLSLWMNAQLGDPSEEMQNCQELFHLPFSTSLFVRVLTFSPSTCMSCSLSSD